VDKRERILRAALELFAERGYYGAPVSLIAERANVGSGTIYRYFRDKKKLVNVLYRDWKEAMFEKTMEALNQQDQPLRSLFHGIWEKMTQFALENPEAFVFMEAHHHSPYLDEASQTLSNKITEHFKAMFQMGQAQEVIKDAPAELLKSVVVGAFSEMMKNHWNGELEITEELMAQTEEMCWQAIRR
jgi:AcrR family transcriptional regulator